MKPLSPLLYLKRNFKSALPVFVSIVVGVFLVYFYALFSATTIKTTNVTTFDMVKNYNIVYTSNDKSLPDSFLRKLKEADDSKVIAVRMNPSGFAYYRGGLGGSTMLTFNIFQDDTERLLENYGVRLVEGKLPENNKNEIIVPREYALQNKIGIGDYIGSEVSEVYSVQGKYKICGLTEGSVYFTVISQLGKETKEQVMKCGVIYPIDNLSKEEQKSLLTDLPEYVVYRTYDLYKQELAATLNGMHSLTYILTAIMIIILCIALGNLNAIIITNRRDEFSILNSIGYTKGNISLKLWKENLLTCFIGYIIGIGLTEFVTWLINSEVLFAQGKEIEMINLLGMISAFAMPIFVSFFSLLPSLWGKFSKQSDIIV